MDKTAIIYYRWWPLKADWFKVAEFDRGDDDLLEYAIARHLAINDNELAESIRHADAGDDDASSCCWEAIEASQTWPIDENKRNPLIETPITIAADLAMALDQWALDQSAKTWIGSYRRPRFGHAETSKITSPTLAVWRSEIKALPPDHEAHAKARGLAEQLESISQGRQHTPVDFKAMTGAEFGRWFSDQAGEPKPPSTRSVNNWRSAAGVDERSSKSHAYTPEELIQIVSHISSLTSVWGKAARKLLGT
ncbi:MAG: hypothetical protein AAGG38_10850 [Planctomycetota bacterium]